MARLSRSGRPRKPRRKRKNHLKSALYALYGDGRLNFSLRDGWFDNLNVGGILTVSYPAVDPELPSESLAQPDPQSSDSQPNL